jgi:dephospho-CoA kinase
LSEIKGEMTMRWFGITGGLGCGKTTVAKMLVQRGFPVLDADKISQEVVERGSPGLHQIVKEFGAEVLDSEGELNRLKMAQIVFKDSEWLKKLESIIHPLVQQAVNEKRRWLEAQGTEIAFYDVPLLFEKNLEKQFDGVVVVTCSEEQQIERIRARSHWGKSEIQERLNAQLPLREKVKRATFVLKNDSDLTSLEKQLEILLVELREHSILDGP